MLLLGIVYSIFLQSMSLMALVVLAFLDINRIDNSTNIRFSWKPILALREPNNYYHVLVITLYFWIVLFSFWQVEDSSFLLERLRIKVPFLLLPLAFLGLPRFQKSTFYKILVFFISLMSVSVAAVLLNYVLHFEEVNLMLKQGQSMATPCNHIRFSILLGLGVISGWYLIKEGYRSTGWERNWIKFATVFLFVAIHILSVKTGILCLYGGLFVLVVRHIFTSRSWKMGALILAGLILVPVVAYKAVPSFNTKVHYTLYDLQMYYEGSGSAYGDSGRLVSLKVGADIFRSNPFIGVGAGNLNTAVNDYFRNYFPDYVPLMPHNQFLYVLAGSGILGLFLFLTALVLPLLRNRAYQNDFFLGFYAMFILSFMIEHTIENALGVGIFSSFLIFCLLSESD